jgi:SAM-dependent methyltransferase
MKHISTAAPPPDPHLAYFNGLAPVWDSECAQPAFMLDRLEALDGGLGLAPGMRLLEVGCGTGLISGWLAGRVRPGRLVSADFSPAMLDQARRRGYAADYWQMDICAEGPVTERFDVVLCFHAFPHFRDQPAALRQIRRLLKPGGCLTILHLAGSAQINAFHAGLREPVCHDRLPGADAWPALLHAAGLELISLTDREDLFLLRARPARRTAESPL